MMMQMQYNESNLPPVYGAYPFSYDESSATPHVVAVEQAGDFRPEKKIRKQPARKPAESCRAASEMPLWPSLKGIQSVKKKDSSWKEDVRLALSLRAFFVGAVMLSMTACGLVLGV